MTGKVNFILPSQTCYTLIIVSYVYIQHQGGSMCSMFEEQQGGQHVRLNLEKGTVVVGEFRDKEVWAILRSRGTTLHY